MSLINMISKLDDLETLSAKKKIVKNKIELLKKGNTIVSGTCPCADLVNNKSNERQGQNHGLCAQREPLPPKTAESQRLRL